MPPTTKPALWEKIVGVVGCLAIFGIWFQTGIYGEAAEVVTHGDWFVLVAVGLLALIPLGIVAATSGSSGVSRAGWLLAPTLSIALLAGIALLALRSERKDGALAAYCYYGAVSRAQLDGCLDHVTWSDLDRETSAAKFAGTLGEESECGPSSGPYCEEFLGRQAADYVGP